MSAVLEKFLRYVALDTQSQDGTGQVPSTQQQWVLARLLREELAAMGARDVRLDETHGYVYATIPATCTGAPKLGFIAHMDTSPAVSGADVRPQMIRDYDGGDIMLRGSGAVLSPAEYPALSDCRGMDIVTTDGTTLLGADDKAGVAEIMQMAETLLGNPALTHGEIKLAFTPDEEVGAGVDFFDVAGFDADFAYTVDGGLLGELSYENFNAAGARVTVSGTSIHPGTAKGKMINALLVAMEFQRMLPDHEKPEATEGYEGFYHLDTLNGGCDTAEMVYILRDHDREKFERKKTLILSVGDFLNTKYRPGTVKIDMQDSYFNMREVIEKHHHLVDTAVTAMRNLDITPDIRPIRGGTDGARLSFMGLPCPNLCTGGDNFHGRFEFIPVQAMERVVELLLEIARLYSEEKPA